MTASGSPGSQCRVVGAHGGPEAALRVPDPGSRAARPQDRDVDRNVRTFRVSERVATCVLTREGACPV